MQYHELLKKLDAEHNDNFFFPNKEQGRRGDKQLQINIVWNSNVEEDLFYKYSNFTEQPSAADESN
jgi:hypothetical protein